MIIGPILKNNEKQNLISKSLDASLLDVFKMI